MRNNESAFTSLGYLLFLSLLLVVCPIVLLTFLTIKTFSHNQNECRRANLKAQKILADSLNSLIKMNASAKSLRSEEDSLEALIRIAKDPITLAALITKLNINRAKQFQHRYTQEKIILKAKYKAQTVLQQFKTVNANSFFTPANLFIYKTPQMRIAQDVNTMPNFESLQKIKISWSTEELSITKNLKVHKLESACIATLNKKGDLWNPQLKRAL